MESQKINYRICVTGGSGFIGTNLVEHLHKNGHTVINIDKSFPRNPSHTKLWYEIDILNQHELKKAITEFDPDILLHLAARTDLNEENDINGYNTNTRGVENIVEAIQSTPSIQRTIFLSSQLVCEIGYQPKHDDDYKPSTLYGQSKVITEQIIKSSNLPSVWTILRPTSIWGPWFDQPYKAFFLTIAKNQYFHPGNLRILKQWGYVGNSVYQIEKIMSAPKEKINHKTYYLADHTPIELKHFANIVQETIGANPIKTLPISLLKTAATVGDILKQIGWKTPPLTTFRLNNITTSEIQNLEPVEKIVGDLPYSIDKGIELTINWLRAQDQKSESPQKLLRYNQ